MNNDIYQEVPSVISSKDLAYLSDMFSWNYLAYKKAINGSNAVNDMDIKDILDEASEVFYDGMNEVLDILNNGGSNE